MSRRHDNRPERDAMMRRVKRLQLAARVYRAGSAAAQSQPIDQSGLIGLIGELDHLICDLAREMAAIDCEIGRLSHQARAISAYSRRNAPHTSCSMRAGHQ